MKKTKWNVCLSVQFKTMDPQRKRDQVTTHMVSVSCDNYGKPFINSDVAWSIPLNALQPID